MTNKNNKVINVDVIGTYELSAAEYYLMGCENCLMEHVTLKSTTLVI